MRADKTILQIKYVSVIKTFAKEMQIPYRTALDIFYKSLVYQKMRAGISDMHCRSKMYLFEEIYREIIEKFIL
ncbi:hypothetical protein FACS189465_0640 [Clostridia bacterium]|nr:hypothetical protein FACS189465_0640 [Clostridia bacterium]